MMEYLLPKELSFQFDISLKTVYNYISKYPNKISVKKEYGKTLVSLQEFTEVFQKVNNTGSKPLQNPITKSPVQKTFEDVGTQIEKDSELQEAYDAVLSKKEELEVVLDEKERQLAKYGELYMDVKKEKKELESKYDELQKNHIASIDIHAQSTIVSERKYNRLLIITSVAIVILLFISLLYSYPDLIAR